MSIYFPGCYKSYDLFCEKCNKLIKVEDTLYVKGLPKFCKQCKTPITFGCRNCSKSYRSCCEMQRHSKFRCGKSPHISCPVCDYKSYYLTDMKSHVRRRHRMDLPIYRECPKCNIKIKDFRKHNCS